MGIENPLNPEPVRRRALAKAYEVLIQLAEEFDKQAVQQGDVGEETGEQREQATTIPIPCTVSDTTADEKRKKNNGK